MKSAIRQNPILLMLVKSLETGWEMDYERNIESENHSSATLIVELDYSCFSYSIKILLFHYKTTDYD